MTTKREAEKTEAREKLLEVLKPGTRVRTILRHCSRSGMQREISMVIVDPRDGDLMSIDYWASQLLGYRIGKNGGLVCGGGGMDMGFHLVYVLGQSLWPNGTPEPHGRRNGQPDTAGGYALKHDWL